MLKIIDCQSNLKEREREMLHYTQKEVILKKRKETNVGKDLPGPAPVGNSLKISQNIKKRTQPYNLVFLFPTCVYTQPQKPIQIILCMPIFIAALLVIVKI